MLEFFGFLFCLFLLAAAFCVGLVLGGKVVLRIIIRNGISRIDVIEAMVRDGGIERSTAEWMTGIKRRN